MAITRRDALKTSLAIAGLAGWHSDALGQQQQPRRPDRVDPPAGERPVQDKRVRVLNPRGRVPLSFIIDDSTCLVNLAHFCIPHFAEVYPARYKQDWRRLPRSFSEDCCANSAIARCDLTSRIRTMRNCAFAFLKAMRSSAI